MSPRPKLEHLRKPQIVAAAAEVIYERGLQGARIGDIAKKAGTSSPAVLYYFDSKDRLFEEVVDQSDREFYARLSEGQARHERAADKLVHLVEETTRGLDGINDYTLWLEMWVRARRNPTVRRNYFRLNRRERILIAEIVRQGQAEGEFRREVEPDDFALLLSGLMDGLGIQVTLGQPDVTPKRMVERCLALASSELGCDLHCAKWIGDGTEKRNVKRVSDGNQSRPQSPTRA